LIFLSRTNYIELRVRRTVKRKYYYPEREEWESLRTLVTFLAGHDLNLLAQIEVIAA